MPHAQNKTSSIMEAVSFLNLHFIEMSITSREEPVKQL